MKKHKRKKSSKDIGLALGGGSVRGLAHIGVLKVLEEEGIPVSYIAGTSIGAVIGGAYCSGLKATEIEEIALTTPFQDLMDFTIPKKGLLIGRKIEKFMNKITREKSFKDLLIPFSVIATDLEKAEEVILTKGNVARAIRASIAIPPFFNPVLIGGHVLADGGLVDPVPVNVVKEMGADKVIAIDVSHNIDVQYAAGSNTEEKSSFAHTFYETFIKSEYTLAREIFRERKIRYLPEFIKKFILRFFDRFLNPKRLINYFKGRQVPEILIIMLKQLNILTNQLGVEKLKDPVVDMVIRPKFKNVGIFEFEQAKVLIKAGEHAAKAMMPEIRKLIK